jgi:hypothetical protein
MTRLLLIAGTIITLCGSARAAVTTGQCNNNPWASSMNNQTPPSTGALLWTTTCAGSSGGTSMSADGDASSTTAGWVFYSVASSYHMWLCHGATSTVSGEWEPCTDGQVARIDGPAWSWGISPASWSGALVSTQWMPAPPVCSTAVQLGSATDCLMKGNSGNEAMVVKDIHGLVLTKPFSNGDGGGPCSVTISGTVVEAVVKCPVSESIDGSGANATVQTW